jgi:hypothetical protein
VESELDFGLGVGSETESGLDEGGGELVEERD